MEFKDRLKELIDYKKVNGKKASPYSIGRDTIVSRVSVLDYLNKGSKPSPIEQKRWRITLTYQWNGCFMERSPKRRSQTQVPALSNLWSFL